MTVALAERVARRLARLDGVEAVALGGSRAAATADDRSDIDLYIYAQGEPPVAERAAAITELGTAGVVEVGNRTFEAGDEWKDATSGIAVDVMYRDPAWIEDRLAAVLDRHEASLGYSTCLWFNVRTSTPLVDPSGWLAALRRRAAVDYPEPLRRAIVAHNLPMLRARRSSYLRQLELAAERDDHISVNHRSAVFLASWFDVLFAVHRAPHPGKKRLLSFSRGAGLVDAAAQRLLDRLMQGSAVEKVAAADELARWIEALAAAEDLSGDWRAHG